MTEQFGFNCHSIDDNLSIIETPFGFSNGSPLPIYTEEIHNKIRIFDGGETLLHFAKQGYDLAIARKSAFILNAIEPFGVTLTPDGEIEVFEYIHNAKTAFSKFIYAMFAVVNWELENEGKSPDSSILVTEVSMYFKSAYPNDEQHPSDEYTGISGHKYKFDFIHGDKAVLAITPHHASVAAAIKKIIDINLREEHKIKPFVIIDDRINKTSADNETKIISAVSSVMAFSKLEAKANVNLNPN